MIFSGFKWILVWVLVDFSEFEPLVNVSPTFYTVLYIEVRGEAVGVESVWSDK